MHKLFDNVSVNRSLDADVRTDDATGENVVDTQGYRDAMLVGVAGDVTDTTGDSYTLKVYESDSSTQNFTDSGVSVAFSDDGNSNTVQVARIAELNVVRKRFLRVDLECTATTTSFEGAGMILLGEPYQGAVNSD